MNTNARFPASAAYELWVNMDRMERALHGQKLVQLSFGPAVAIMILVGGFFSPPFSFVFAIMLAAPTYALTYLINRERLTARLLAGHPN